MLIIFYITFLVRVTQICNESGFIFPVKYSIGTFKRRINKFFFMMGAYNLRLYRHFPLGELEDTINPLVPFFFIHFILFQIHCKLKNNWRSRQITLKKQLTSDSTPDLRFFYPEQKRGSGPSLSHFRWILLNKKHFYCFTMMMMRWIVEKTH